ncbi:MAG: ATP synthase F0 subunit C [Planctomycetota bacterium]
MTDSISIIQIGMYLSAGLCIGFGAIGPAMGVGTAAGYGVRAMRRQPKQSSQLLRNMLISQAVSETPGIFSLVLALIFLFTDATAESENLTSFYGAYAIGAAYLGGAFAMGVASLGSGAGNGLVASQAVNTMSINPRETSQTLVTMFIGQALGQTPVIFGLLVAFFLKYKIGLAGAIESAAEWSDALIVIGKSIGAGIAMGAGAIGPAIGISFVGQSAAKTIGRRIENRSLVMRTLFIGAAVSESTSIYSLVIALLLIMR